MAEHFYDPDTGEEVSKEEYERIIELEEQFDQDYEDNFDDYDSFDEGEYLG